MMIEKLENKARNTLFVLISCLAKPLSNLYTLNADFGRFQYLSLFIPQFYAGGVFDTVHCSSTKVAYAVLIVGYGEYSGKKYWLVKNR